MSVTLDAPLLEDFATDFGRIARRVPGLIAHPTQVEQVPVVLRVARDHRLSVAARGSGHGQAGHCLVEGGVVLDARGLNRVLRVDTGEGVVEAEAGAKWRALVDASKAHGLLPRGLTHVTEPTVGGTLSVAGVGAESWSVGAQVNAVAWLDVAMADGNLVRCSRETNRDLFDAVRSGLGQCGIIVRAGHPVRESRPLVGYVSLLYEHAEPFVADVDRVCSERRADFVSAMIVETPDSRPWSLLLMLGKEHASGSSIDESSLLADLGFGRALPTRDVPVWTEDGAPGHMFFRRYDPPAGPPPLHPWVEHLFSAESVIPVLEEMLSGRTLPLRLGTNAIIIVARTGTPAPLLSVPSGDGLMFGVGLFVSVPEIMREVALPMMAEHSQAWCRAGGKRYMSGFVDFQTEAAWAEHYGSAWPRFCEMKRRWDADGVLGRDAVIWPSLSG